MRYLYTIQENMIADELGKLHTVYGVQLTEISTGRMLASVPDVFCCARQAESFIKLSNDLQLDPIHMMDVIEDFINM